MKIYNNCTLGQRNQLGFTMIELMIVVILVGVLMAIALPSYTDYVNKGRRSDAMSALMDASNRQEQLMLDRNSYTTNIANLGMTNPTTEGHYNITVNAATANCPINRCYSMTATPLGTSPQADDARCTSFTLTSSGAKTATGSHAADCWSR